MAATRINSTQFLTVADTRSAATAGAGAIRNNAGYLETSDGTNWLPVFGTWRSASVNLGSKPVRSGNFVLTTTGLVTGRQIIVKQGTGSGANADDLEWDFIKFNGIATSNTTANIYWSSATFVSGSKIFNYHQV